MKRLLLLLFISLLFVLSPVASQIRINEFMQSNVDCLIDDINEFPDSWIELYNAGDESVSLQDWSLSDQKESRNAWRITEKMEIAPKGYLVLYCDKTNNGQHAPFRLESGKGCNIYLFDANGEEVDKILNYPKQPAPNIACGRLTDGATDWGYFVQATPGKANSGITSSILLPSPLFSKQGGIYREAVTVELSLPAIVPDGVTPSAIRYTTDGSEPTAESSAYHQPLTFDRPTCLRAKIIAPGYLPNRSVTHSYIVVDRELTLPIVSIATDEAYLFDPYLGIYIEGKYNNKTPNYMYGWRRPMNIEYYPSAETDAVINQLGEMRVGGGFSRTQYESKTFMVYANKRFGEKRFDYPVFTTKGEQEIKSFMLRNSGSDFASMGFRDAAFQQFLGGKVNLDYQACQPAILFINGEYFGFQNIRERSNEDFVVANYNGLEEIDMVENWPGKTFELKAGDLIDFNDLMEKLALPLEQVPYEELMQRIDIDAYLNYMILQIFGANVDFPHNNVVIWRPRTEKGQWRFILKDTDNTINFSEKPTFKAIDYNMDLSIEKTSRLLFHRLMHYTPFNEAFAERFAIYLGDRLHPTTTCAIIDSMRLLLDTEIPFHKARWNNHDKDRDYTWWLGAVQRTKDWCRNRIPYMYQELNDACGKKGLTPMRIVVPEGIIRNPLLTFNGIPLENPCFDGQFFREEQVNIDIQGEEPYKDLYWRVIATVDNETVITELPLQAMSYQIPARCSDLQIVLYDTMSSVAENSNYRIDCYKENNRLIIHGLTGKSTIRLYDTTGRMLMEHKGETSSMQLPMQTKATIILQIDDAAGRHRLKIQ